MTQVQVTKSQMHEGSMVRLHDEAVDQLNARRVRMAEAMGTTLDDSRTFRYDEAVEVVDMMDRSGYSKRDHVAVKKVGTGLASRVHVVDVAEVVRF